MSPLREDEEEIPLMSKSDPVRHANTPGAEGTDLEAQDEDASLTTSSRSTEEIAKERRLGLQMIAGALAIGFIQVFTY